MSLQTKSSQLKEVFKRAEEIIVILWHRLVRKWGKILMFWFNQSALHIWCKILITCSIKIYIMSKGKYSATFMLFNLGWKSWGMTNTARFPLHLFPNESSLTWVAFAHKALLVRGVIFFSFLFSYSTIPSETVAHRQLHHHEVFLLLFLTVFRELTEAASSATLTHFFHCKYLSISLKLITRAKMVFLPPAWDRGRAEQGAAAK